MPVYEYLALDAFGKSCKGIIDADSPRAARQKLGAAGIYLSELRELHFRESGASWGRFPLLLPWERLRSTDLVGITRQLATLLAAGLPLVAALTAILEQVRKTALRKVLSQVRDRLTQGMSLAAALKEHPSAFPSIYPAMVHAGETSGTLEVIMERLADFGEQQLALQRKIRSVLAYPLLMLIVETGVVFFLMAYVIPRVSKIFLDMKQALPLPTILLVRIASFFKTFWPVLLLACALAWLFGHYYSRTDRGRSSCHGLMLRLPIIGGIVQKTAIARISRTLATLLSNGVPLLSSLEIVGTVVDNVVLSKAIEEARQEISGGASIAAPFASSGVFPPTVIQMISVGEQSGDLEGMLFKIAATLEAEVEARVTMLTSLLEPVMILFLGVLVGFVVLAVLLPIFEMSHLVR